MYINEYVLCKAASRIRDVSWVNNCCLDIQHEDSGNYTCEVNGPHNVLLGAVTHYIYVRGTVHAQTMLCTCDVQVLACACVGCQRFVDAMHVFEIASRKHASRLGCSNRENQLFFLPTNDAVETPLTSISWNASVKASSLMSTSE